MSTKQHNSLLTTDLHVPGYQQDSDPGAIGAGKVWVDTSAGTGLWILKTRNATNTGWEGLGSSSSTYFEGLVLSYTETGYTAAPPIYQQIGQTYNITPSADGTNAIYEGWDAAINVPASNTQPVGTIYGINFVSTIAGSGLCTANDTAIFRSIISAPTTSVKGLWGYGSNRGTVSGFFYGIQGNVDNRSDNHATLQSHGTIATAVGGRFRIANDTYNTWGDPATNAAITLSEVLYLTTDQSVTGALGKISTIGTAYGIKYDITNGANCTIGTSYGIYLTAPSNSGTITNHYGLYLADQTVAGTTLNYSIYSAGGKNYLAGGLITPKIYPATDTITALQFNKADGITNVLNIDTTNARVGIGSVAPSNALDIGTNTTGLNAKVYATLTSDVVPSFDAANWTCTNGWSADGVGTQLTKVSNAAIGTITPSGAGATPTIGVTYKIVIVCSAKGSPAVTYTYGGVTGTTITATTITDYITASDTTKLIISGAVSSTCTITSVTIQPLTDATGDTTIEGNLLLGSSIQNLKGTDCIYLGTTGSVGIGVKPTSPGTTYKLDIGGNVRMKGANPSLNWTPDADTNAQQFLFNNSAGSAKGRITYYVSTPTDTMGFWTANAQRMWLDATGLGIGVSSITRKLEVNEASGNCLRLIYNDSDGSPANYVDFLVGSSGDLTIQASGGDISFDNENIGTTGAVKGVHKAADGTAAVADGTYTVGCKITPVTGSDGTITIKDGIITNIQQAT